MFPFLSPLPMRLRLPGLQLFPDGANALDGDLAILIQSWGGSGPSTPDPGLPAGYTHLLTRSILATSGGDVSNVSVRFSYRTIAPSDVQRPHSAVMRISDGVPVLLDTVPKGVTPISGYTRPVGALAIAVQDHTSPGNLAWANGVKGLTRSGQATSGTTLPIARVGWRYSMWSGDFLTVGPTVDLTESFSGNANHRFAIISR